MVKKQLDLDKQSTRTKVQNHAWIKHLSPKRKYDSYDDEESMPQWICNIKGNVENEEADSFVKNDSNSKIGMALKQDWDDAVLTSRCTIWGYSDYQDRKTNRYAIVRYVNKNRKF